MFTTSDTADQIIPAIFKARQAFDPLVKRGVNTFIKDGQGKNAKYVKLEDVISSIEASLEANGLLLTQAVGLSMVTERTVTVTGKNDAPVDWPVFSLPLTTRIWHTSGQWIEFTSSLFYIGEKALSLAQVGGKVITYLRRYAITSLFGLVTDEDNDGQPTVVNLAQPEKPPYLSEWGKQWSALFPGKDAARSRFDAILNALGKTRDEIADDHAFLDDLLAQEKVRQAGQRESDLAEELAAIASQNEAGEP